MIGEPKGQPIGGRPLTLERFKATIEQMKGAHPMPAPSPSYFVSLITRPIVEGALARGTCERLAMISCRRDHMTYQRVVKVLHQVRRGELDPKTGAELMRRLLVRPLPFLGAVVEVEGQTFRSHTMMKPQYTNHTEHQSVIDPDTGIPVFVFAITEGADLADAPKGEPFVFGPTHKVVANVDGGYFGMWWAYKHADKGGIHKWDEQWNSETEAVAAVALIIKKEGMFYHAPENHPLHGQLGDSWTWEHGLATQLFTVSKCGLSIQISAYCSAPFGDWPQSLIDVVTEAMNVSQIAGADGLREMILTRHGTEGLFTYTAKIEEQAEKAEGGV